MRVLVTGASGFLGGHLVEACARAGDSVRALVRKTSDLSQLARSPEVEPVVGDLRDATTLRAACDGIDVVHHAAARAMDHGSRADFVEANVEGTRRLLDAARGAGVSRFVFVSTPSVVMGESEQVDVDESAPYPRRYLNLYSETKAQAERDVLAASGPRFVTCALRPRAIWGPRDRYGWLPTVLARLAARRMPDMSGGHRVLASICYVDHAVEACLRAARADASKIAGKPYFVTDREPLDVWAFADVLVTRFGVPPITRRVDPRVLHALTAGVELAWKIPALGHHRRPPLSRYSVALLTRTATYDTRAAARDLGFVPTITRDEGLARTAAWIDANGGLDAFTRFVRRGSFA